MSINLDFGTIYFKNFENMVVVVDINTMNILLRTKAGFFVDSREHLGIT